MQIPNGMVAVSKEEFFAALYADPRDIMPTHNAPDHTQWETKSRQLWGWSTPGWKNPGTEHQYAIFEKVEQAGPNGLRAGAQSPQPGAATGWDSPKQC